MDFLVGEADVGGGGNVPVWNFGNMLIATVAALPGHITPLLRCIIFLCQSHLGAGFDDQSIGLGSVDLGQNGVVGFLGPSHTAGALGCPSATPAKTTSPQVDRHSQICDLPSPRPGASISLHNGGNHGQDPQREPAPLLGTAA